MSEPSHLIPNLSKMMEAYTKVEEETVQETQSREMQEEERAEAREELEPLVGESRKKIGELKKLKQSREMKRKGLDLRQSICFNGEESEGNRCHS